jgi:ribulose 1,5-bisphosphate carboxylase large subunit-like protein
MTPRPHWLDAPRNVQRLWRGFQAVLALAVLAELAVALHPHFAIESIFGFAALYGFLACALMIVVAKLLGLLLKRPDRYYEADDE